MTSKPGIDVTLTQDLVQDVLGSLAELWIAANETHAVEQDAERAARLDRASKFFDRVDRAFRLRAEADRARADLSRGTE